MPQFSRHLRFLPWLAKIRNLYIMQHAACSHAFICIFTFNAKTELFESGMGAVVVISGIITLYINLVKV